MANVIRASRLSVDARASLQLRFCLLAFNLGHLVLISKNVQASQILVCGLLATRCRSLINKRARDFFPIKCFNYGPPGGVEPGVRTVFR